MSARCINCGISLHHRKFKTLAEFDVGFLELVSKWISPVLVCGSHALCDQCVSEGEAGGGARPLGHQLVCVSCGCSLMRKRWRHVHPSEPAADVLRDWAGQYYNERMRYTCQACNMRARRTVQKQQRLSQGAPEPAPNTAPPREEKSHMSLETYVRVLAGGGCVFAGCGRAAGGVVPLHARQHLLRTHRRYVCGEARVCTEHANTRDWTPLLKLAATSEFEASQIEDMAFLAKGVKPIDWESPSSLDPHLLRRWTGVTPAQFECSLQRVGAPARALALHLVRGHTGEPPSVLASLFQTTTADIALQLDTVSRCLEDTLRQPPDTDANTT